jgi:ribosomal protein S18 acetylase RimI-like enzyme
MNLSLRRCDSRDRDLLHGLRDHTERWLTARGWGEQADARWSERAHAAIDRLLDSGRFVALSDNDWPLAVGAFSAPDLDFWTSDDDLSSAWYVARMMTAHHGHGYGALLVEMIAVAAAADGRDALRLDCMRENLRLHDYYRSLGFTLVRLVEHPDRRSGALFERPLAGLVPQPWDHL